MRILWLDINSSYSHTSVALPAIHAQISSDQRYEWRVLRGTINDNPGELAAAAAEHNPDAIAATFWLFTHNMQLEVLSRVIQLLPNVKIICGGPEFLGNNEDFLRKHTFIHAVIRGEGEESLPFFLDEIENKFNWKAIDGLCWINREDGIYYDNGTARVSDFSSLKYPEESSFFNWEKPFVQLETTRGCFNTCAFCVSGGEKPVRYQSLEQVSSRLKNICSHGIKDIRVLDRTFNYDSERACDMLDIFSEYEGKMRFHLEIHPSLLSEPLKEKLAALPTGLLHLEAGIQSLHSCVLEECGRKGSLKTSIDGLEYLCSLKNIETHADLIAGLPLYSFDMLCTDIARLIKIGVNELQIESLKVLPGTKMRKEADLKELKYSPLPPYEVLKTPQMSPCELRKAMMVSRMVDLYYNCSAWQNITRNLVADEEGFINKFTQYLKERMVLDSPLSIERRGLILYEYCLAHCPERVADVSLAWIQAGLSLKKSPAGDIQKIKDIESYISEIAAPIEVEFGELKSTHRYYIFASDKVKAIFGYDSENHQPSPVFFAKVIGKVSE